MEQVQFTQMKDGTREEFHHPNGIADFHHTEVVPAFGGRGVAGRLVRFAMDDVRAAGQWKIRASCRRC